MPAPYSKNIQPKGQSFFLHIKSCSLQFVDFWKAFYKNHTDPSFKKQLKGVLGYSPGNAALYKTALTHRSVKETLDENNERLEYLGDAILSALVADYLFKRYPYKEEKQPLVPLRCVFFGGIAGLSEL